MGQDPNLETDRSPSLGGMFGVKLVRTHYNQIYTVIGGKVEYLEYPLSVKYLFLNGERISVRFADEFIQFLSRAISQLVVKLPEICGIGLGDCLYDMKNGQERLVFHAHIQGDFHCFLVSVGQIGGYEDMFEHFCLRGMTPEKPRQLDKVRIHDYELNCSSAVSTLSHGPLFRSANDDRLRGEGISHHGCRYECKLCSKTWLDKIELNSPKEFDKWIDEE